MDCTLENLTSLIAEHAIIDPSLITPDAAFGSLGFDSLDHIDLIMEVEDLFQVEIPEPIAARCLTVADLHQAILNASPE
jgi:acyl carrier protein